MGKPEVSVSTITQPRCTVTALSGSVQRTESWTEAFLAEPEEVASLRRLVWVHLTAWGAHELIDSAQLCVSELVSNVITHVGRGTPTNLSVALSSTCLRIEVRDPDARALPTLLEASDDAEGGRGMGLVQALAKCWGVVLHADCKVTWCELATAPPVSGEPAGSARVVRATKVLSSYRDGQSLPTPRHSRLGSMAAEAAAIDVITDLLHWLQVHGHDPDEVLDRAQTHFEAELRAATRVTH